MTFRPYWAALALAVAVGPGCGAIRDVRVDAAADAFEDYNRGQAAGQNRILLLNVLRARDRLPKQFSTIGNASISQQIGFSVGPLSISRAGTTASGGSRTLTRAASLGASMSTTPQLSVGPLDSQGFYRGILAPLKGERVHYFLTQGWQPELIFHLAVHSIKLPNGVVLENVPGSASYEAFQAVVRDIAPRMMGSREVRVDPDWTVQPPIDPADLAKVASQIALGTAGYTVKCVQPTPGGCADFRIGKLKSTYEWTLGPRSSIASNLEGSFSFRGVDKNTLPLLLKDTNSLSVRDDASRPAHLELSYRSPEGILHYLGQLVRWNGRVRLATAANRACDQGVELFRISSASESSQSFVSVEYEGEKFVANASPCERTASVFQFVLLNIGLQKDGSETPSPSGAVLVNPGVL